MFLALVMMVLISSMTCASIFIIFFSIYIFFHLSLAHLEEPLFSEILNDLNDLDLNDRNDQIPAPYAIITRCICLMKSLRFTNVSPKVSRHFRSFSGYSRKLRVSMSPFMLM